jgi:hypothetical protein
MAYPATELDATANKLLDTAVLEESQSFRQLQFLAGKSAQQLSNCTDNIFLQMTQLYQAQASQLVQTNKLASDILAQRSSMNQPQQTPSFVTPVVVTPDGKTT